MPSDEDTTQKSYFGVDRSGLPYRFARAPEKRALLDRLVVFLRALPALVREAWDETRYRL